MTDREARRSAFRALSTIRFRIVAAMLVSLLMTLAATGLLVVQLRQNIRSNAVITQGYLPLSKIVAQLKRDQERVDKDVDRLLSGEQRPGTGRASTTLIYTDQLQQVLAEGDIHARHAQGLDLPSEDRAALHAVRTHLDTIESLFVDYQAASSRLVELAEAGRLDEAEEVAVPLKRDANRLGEEIDKLDRLLEARIGAVTDTTAQSLNRAQVAGSVLVAFAFGIAVVIVGLVLHALSPIGRLTTEVQRLAGGEYGGQVDVRGTDEIALLAAEFNAMVRALQLRDRTLVERAEELNKLSRYLGSVLDGLQDGLLVVENGAVTLRNPAAERVWRAAEGQAPPDALSALLAEPGRHELAGPDGTLHEVRVTPFGESGVVVITADVTEQTRAKEQLARSQRLALVGQMLAQITHEVRNPLNAMSLNAELLADDLAELDPDKRTEAWEQLAIVTGEIERLTDVTAHYLQLARRPPARLEPENVAMLVEDVRRLLDAELSSQHVELDVRVQPVPEQLVDGNQLRQALLNVVRNAVEAGAHQLELSLEREDGEVCVRLSDDGPGMSAEEAERAIDPFFSTKASGTGLGLAITKQILEDHGGSLRVTSEPGRGTTIVLALPDRPPRPSKRGPCMPQTILVVDDDASNRVTLERILGREGYEVAHAASGREAMEHYRARGADLVLTDLKMPGMSGIELLKAVRTVDPDIEVLVMTAYGTVETAVEAMKEGAYDFVSKPLKRLELVNTVRKALEKRELQMENRRLREQLGAVGEGEIIGKSEVMRALLDEVEQVAPSDATVLLSGESGTGKGRLARLLHRMSRRKDARFVTVNCAAIPESLMESELFGYEKGAFTGAVARKEGRFDIARAGTLFLDEITEMQPAVQVKLLRVLQDGEYERVGGTETLQADVRVIAATNRDIEAEVDAGTFRQDLFYRLNVIRIGVPPLRERYADIPLLAQHFLVRFTKKNAKEELRSFTPDALEALAGYTWPGNVRELENAVERAVVLCRDTQVGLDDLPPAVAPGRRRPPAPGVRGGHAAEGSRETDDRGDAPRLWRGQEPRRVVDGDHRAHDLSAGSGVGRG